MVRADALLSEKVLRKQLGVSKKRLAVMVTDGRIFAIDVNGVNLFPAILGSSDLRLTRLWNIAKIIVPAPPALRLDFLTQPCAALEDRIPINMLDGDRDYEQLREYAKAWASEFSRTFVVVWDADALDDLSRAKPIYTCSSAIDPRRPLWRRALNAIRSPGYTQPADAPRAPAELVVVVERATAGQGGAPNNDG